MFEGGVPEKIISEKSGHKSIKALRTYERTTADQDRAACSTIAQSGNLFQPKQPKLENEEQAAAELIQKKFGPSIDHSN